MHNSGLTPSSDTLLADVTVKSSEFFILSHLRRLSLIDLKGCLVRPDTWCAISMLEIYVSIGGSFRICRGASIDSVPGSKVTPSSEMTSYTRSLESIDVAIFNDIFCWVFQTYVKYMFHIFQPTHPNFSTTT